MTKPKLPKRPHRRNNHRRQQSKRRSSTTTTAASLILLTTSTLYLTANPTAPQHTQLFFAQAIPTSCNPCLGIDNGFIQIPETACGEFAQCASGIISQKFTCQGGLIFDATLGQCNWETSATCGPDYECPTESPTGGPTESPVSEEPTESPTADWDTDDDDGEEEEEESLDAGPSTTLPLPPAPPPIIIPEVMAPISAPVPVPIPPPAPGLEPLRLTHHSAVWAHLNANKITISNQLLRVSHRLHDLNHNIDSDELRNYAYHDFYYSIRSMAEEGYAVPMAPDQVDPSSGQPLLARSVLYLGDPTYDDAAAVGLVNIAAFLAQAMGDSISSGSCDEINQDLVNGQLPQSNSCGQYGQSYQDMHCANENERFMECSVVGEMMLNANDNGRGHVVNPFFCGSREVYPSTGSAAYIAGRAPVEDPVMNRNERTDVEGCCWWGRGTINTRGVCQYGKLNYYLGARAAQEGRPARYPQIDFCSTPQTICSSQPQDSQIEWISGLFRWIDDVQSYNSDDGATMDDGGGGGGWNYIQKLHDFVSGGMVDGLFFHSVSAIVTQGCHEAPCQGVAGTGVEMTDAGVRWSFFLQVLEALGLPVNSLRQS